MNDRVPGAVPFQCSHARHKGREGGRKGQRERGRGREREGERERERVLTSSMYCWKMAVATSGGRCNDISAFKRTFPRNLCVHVRDVT